MKSVTLRLWDEKPQNTRDLKIVTKLSDLGSPMSIKSLLGFYMNVRQEFPFTPHLRASHDLGVFYRLKRSSKFIHLCTFEGALIANQPGNMYLESILKTPISNIDNVQLKIEGTVKGKFSINDFGLLYRTYREISAQDHNED